MDRNSDSRTQPKDARLAKLHTEAVQHLRRGMHAEAIACWEKILTIDPNSPRVREWIEKARKKSAPKPVVREKVKTWPEPPAAESRADAATELGTGSVPEQRDQAGDADGFSADTSPPHLGAQLADLYDLHRGTFWKIVSCMALVVIILGTSLFNSRTFWMSIHPKTGVVTIYQGYFLPAGSEATNTLTLGLGAEWYKQLDRPEVSESLTSRFRIQGYDNLLLLIESIYLDLAAKSLADNELESYEKAIFYFKRARSMELGTNLDQELAQAYFSVAKLYEVSDRPLDAKVAFSKALVFDPSLTEAAERAAALEKPADDL